MVSGEKNFFDINAKDKDGNTALHYAMNNVKFYLAVTPLLEAGADSLLRDAKGYNSCYYAVQLNTNEILEKMYEYATDRKRLLNDTNGSYKETPLMTAANNKNIANVQWLASKKYLVNLNVQDTCGNTALHYAFQRENYVAVDILIQVGARQDIKNNDGRVASYYDRRGCIIS